jgi:hypothetical protein
VLTGLFVNTKLLHKSNIKKNRNNQMITRKARCRQPKD